MMDAAPSNLRFETLAASVDGNLKSFETISSYKQRALVELEKPASLRLTRGGLKKVLLALRDGQVAPTIVQKWATFVRFGVLADPTDREPAAALDIEFDEEADDQIVEVLSRLDDLEDRFNGPISETEIDEMIRTLD